VKETQLQINLPGVPKAKQGREVAPRWEWTEASVWTERRLTALEQGVKGGNWFSLMDKVWKMENLQSAVQQVRRNQGAKQALRRVDQLLKTGHHWVVDADLKGYFDSIPQDKLVEAVETQIADGAVLELIGLMLRQGVMESGKGWQSTPSGTPQGAVISPLLANIYLNPLDHLMARQGKEMVRYADDFVILCQSEQAAQEVLEQLRQWTQAAGLTLHPTKTRIVEASQSGGFDFLGYHFERGYRWPRKKILVKFKETIREKTKSGRPGSLRDIIREINHCTRGWFEYFKHSQNTVFQPLDGWIRQRLRRMLRRRYTGSRRAACRDYQRWPVAYFAQLGLISLALARRKASHAR
jgi:RNA-directed DNA polymerase